ncbi:MAG TPA: hypothetical protein PLV42_07525 [bacterium]|nr:hypothetical protein [bacterium]
MARSSVVGFLFALIITVSCATEDETFCVIDEDCGDTAVYFCDKPTGECREKNTTSDNDTVGGGDTGGTEKDQSDRTDQSDPTDQSDDGLPTGDNQPDSITDDAAVSDSDAVNPSLDPVTNLKIDSQIDQLILTWTNPTMAGLTSIKVLRDLTAFPQDPGFGELIYEGLDQTYADTAVDAGKNHFYSVFACYGALGCSAPASIGGIPCYNKMDLVFVMDVSTSMDYILADLEAEIGLVWDQVSQKIEATPTMGLTVFVDDVTLVNGGAPYASVAALQGDFHSWYQHTKTNQQTQSDAGNSDWPENSLDGLALTAQNFQWRNVSETLRIIILTTDDTFREKPASFTSGIAAQYNYDETVSLLKGGRIRVAAFAAKIGGSTGTTNVEPGFFTPYNGKDSIPVATNGEVFFIDEVKNGSLSLVDAISDFVESERCTASDQE